jgi:hypothetical protein
MNLVLVDYHIFLSRPINRYIFLADGSDYCVFLDSGYALSGSFITPFSRKRVLTQAEKSFNRSNLIMSDKMTNI